MLKGTPVLVSLLLVLVLLSGCADDKPKSVILDETVDLSAGARRTFEFKVEDEGTRILEYTATHDSGPFNTCLMIKPNVSKWRDGPYPNCAPGFGCSNSLFSFSSCGSSAQQGRVTQEFDGGKYVFGIVCESSAQDGCGVRLRITREEAKPLEPKPVTLTSAHTVSGNQLVVDIDARREVLAIVEGNGSALGVLRLQNLGQASASACLFDGTQQKRYEAKSSPVCLLETEVGSGRLERLSNELPGLRYGLRIKCPSSTDCSIAVKLEGGLAGAEVGPLVHAATSPSGQASQQLPFASTVGIEPRRRVVEAVLVQGGERLNWDVETLGGYGLTPKGCIFEDQFAPRYLKGEAVPCEWSGSFQTAKGFVDLAPGWYGIGYHCDVSGTTDCTVYRHVWLEKTQYVRPDGSAATTPSGADIVPVPINQVLSLSTGRSWVYSFRVDEPSSTSLFSKITTNKTAQAQLCLLQDADRVRASNGDVVKCFHSALVGNADFADSSQIEQSVDLLPGWYAIQVKTTKTSVNANMQLTLTFDLEATA